ncbi:rhomboid family intramembrane serine protease [uncultured Brevundimonas sp.]|uniref:rhomboid family intramembrane serine protease n=1 Tax=uncultured Brevundimonas sp. TaxID=213418 RepID=UPI0030EDC0BA
MTTPAADRPPLFAPRRDARGRRRAGPPIWDRRAWKLLFSPFGVPAFVLLALFAVGLSVQTLAWAVSGQALAEGRWYTLVTHMVAHLGVVHMLLNASVLLPLTPLAMVRLGATPMGWLRFIGLFVGSGLAGAALYLALNPAGLPMVGASGAIFGLWGAVGRIRADGSMAPLRSRRVRDEVLQVLLLNLVVYGLVFILTQIEDGGFGGIAWEAHIGGFLFGLLVMPWLAPRTPPPATC